MSYINLASKKTPVVIVLLVSLLSACTTVQQVGHSPETLRSTLEVGDEIRVTTSGGEEYEFTIESIDEVAISGEGNVISYDDIENVEATRTTDTGATIAVIGGVVVVGAAVWYFILAPIIALASLASFSG